MPKLNTRQFIKVMQSKPCLWNANNVEYNDRIARQWAWQEVAQSMNDNWEDLKPIEKVAKVRDVQKKWKGLRDYFTRENKELKTKSGSVPRRNRQSQYLTLLSFLKVKKKGAVQNYQDYPPAESTIDVDSNSLLTHIKEKSDDVAAISKQQSAGCTHPNIMTIGIHEDITPDRQNYDPDMNFLLSILPDMKLMTPSQNFEFRFEVMTLIKNMRYNEHNTVYCYNAAGPSTFAMSKCKSEIPVQEISEDPIANDTAASLVNIR